MTITNRFNPSSDLKDLEFRGLQDCMRHCNHQIKDESNYTMALSTSVITTVIFIASNIFIVIALSSLSSMSMLALPPLIVPILYASYKLSSLRNEANDRLEKTRQVFHCVVGKYMGNDPATRDVLIKTTQPEGVLSEAKKIINEITTPKVSFLTVTSVTLPSYNNWESLVKVIFFQLLKDQARLDEIKDYQNALYVSSIAMITQGISSQLFGSDFLLAFIIYPAFCGSVVTRSYQRHRYNSQIGRAALFNALPTLNCILEIPKTDRALCIP